VAKGYVWFTGEEVLKKNERIEENPQPPKRLKLEIVNNEAKLKEILQEISMRKSKKKN
jgi:hypothetical protein